MKMRLRFSIHFIIGLLIFMVYSGLVFLVTFELIVPKLGIADSEDNPIVLIILLIFWFVSSGILFSWYFLEPLMFIISLIDSLSKGSYDPNYTNRKIYSEKKKLKGSYSLYKEVITNIHSLSCSLEQGEIERNKLEQTKKDWIAGVSHDLKTPLSYMMGYSMLLVNKDYTWSEEEEYAFLSEIYTKGKYIEELIEDLNLSFKLEDSEESLPLNLTTINLVKFMQNLIADVANGPKAFSYTLSFHSEENDIVAKLDEKLIYRALQNLLVNCINHNPEGTRIHITLAIKSNNLIGIDISDNGVGMEENVVKNIFEKYYRNKTSNDPNFSGGLGLAIVKNIFVAHGGDLSAESISSQGTTFHITIPLKN